MANLIIVVCETMSAIHKPYQVAFGNVLGQCRAPDGEEANLIDPPVFQDDPYFWFRSDDRKDLEVLELLKKENMLTDKFMAPHEPLVETLFEEMKGRMNEDDVDHPHRFYNSDWVHYKRNVKGCSGALYCRKKEKEGDEQILLDHNVLAAGRAYCDVQKVTTNYNGTIMTYAVDCVGNELYTVHFVDLETGRLEDHRVNDLLYARYIWSPTNTQIYYVGHDEAQRPCKLYMYDLATRVHTLLYEERDVLFNVNMYLSCSMRHVVVSVKSSDTAEQYVIEPSVDPAKLMMVRPRRKGVLYEVEDYDEENFLVLTNDEGCVNFGLFVCPRNGGEWTPWIPYDENMYVTGLVVFRDFVGLELREGGFARVGYVVKGDYVIRLVGEGEGEGRGCTTYLSKMHNLCYDSSSMVLTCESLVRPQILMEVGIGAGAEEIVLKEEVVPNYDHRLYESRQLMTEDGVPISMAFRKDKMDGTPKPLYLYAYGAYGYSLDPKFDQMKVSLLDQGIIFCIAHARGGSEKGWSWYLDGKMDKKMNTFLDVIGCAEYLVREGYSTHEMMVGEGRSAGGLTMGATMVMRPDLFRTVVLGVPFVDVMVTMCDASVPLTTGEWTEWGCPNLRGQYEYMRKYSPMENVGIGVGGVGGGEGWSSRCSVARGERIAFG